MTSFSEEVISKRSDSLTKIYVGIASNKKGKFLNRIEKHLIVAATQCIKKSFMSRPKYEVNGGIKVKMH